MVEDAFVHLFVYGSLMFEQVWSRLVRGSYIKRTARLHGFCRRKVKGDVYPVIFRSQGSDWVDGVVYLDVSVDDIARLDFFEGDFYERRNERVVVEGSDKLTAAVYVLADDFYHLADDASWDPDWFAREGLAIFQGHYRGFD